MIALENQNALRDMLVEAEESAKLLFELEMKKRQDQIEAEKKVCDICLARYVIAMPPQWVVIFVVMAGI